MQEKHKGRPWWKRHKRLLLAGTVLLGAGLTSPHVMPSLYADSDYASMTPPSILTTAYRDGQAAIAEADNKASSSGNSGGGLGDALNHAIRGQGDEKANQKNLDDAMRYIVNQGNFGNVGLLIGPRGASDTTKATNIVQSTDGVDTQQMQAMSSALGNDKPQAYHAFGQAIQDMIYRNQYATPLVMEASELSNYTRSLVTKMGNMSVQFISRWNPAPAIMALYDSSYLSGATFAGGGQVEGSTNGNNFVKFINTHEEVRTVFRFFGDPVMGGISRAQLLTYAILFITVIAYVFTRIFTHVNGAMRKLFMQLMIATAGIPIASMILGHGVNMAASAFDSTATTVENSILSRNLSLADWYQNSNFGLPPGYSLEVRNGQFAWNAEIIRAINQQSMKGYSGDNARIDAIRSNSDKTLQVAFRPPTGVSLYQLYAGGGSPWSITALTQIAKVMEKAGEFDAGEIKGERNYLTAGQMQASATGTGYVYSQANSGAGLSPLASFNLLHTSFDDNGMVVKSHTQAATIPSVIIMPAFMGAGGWNEGSHKTPDIIVTIMGFIIAFHGVYALFEILVVAATTLFSGGVGTAFGGVDAFGRLMGGVIALVIGGVGIGIVMNLAIALMDIAYSMTAEFLGEATGLNDLSEKFAQGAKSMPFPFNWIVGSVLQGVGNAIASAILTIAILFLIPRITKIPIQTFSQWCQHIPDTIAARFRKWYGTFTGDYHVPAGRGYAAGAAQQVKSEDRMRTAAIGAGAMALGRAAVGGAAGGLGKFLAGQAGDVSAGAAALGTAADALGGNDKDKKEDSTQAGKEGYSAQSSSDNQNSSLNATDAQTANAQNESTTIDESSHNTESNSDFEAMNGDNFMSQESMTTAESLTTAESMSDITASESMSMTSESMDTSSQTSLNTNSSVQEGSSTQTSHQENHAQGDQRSVDQSTSLSRNTDASQSTSNQTSTSAGDVTSLASSSSATLNASNSESLSQTNAQTQTNNQQNSSQSNASSVSTSASTSTNSGFFGKMRSAASTSGNALGHAAHRTTERVIAANNARARVVGHLSQAVSNFGVGKVKPLQALGHGLMALGGGNNGAVARAGLITMIGGFTGTSTNTRRIDEASRARPVPAQPLQGQGQGPSTTQAPQVNRGDQPSLGGQASQGQATRTTQTSRTTETRQTSQTSRQTGKSSTQS